MAILLYLHLYLSHTHTLQSLSRLAEKVTYAHGDVLHREGAPQTAVFALSVGDVSREKSDPQGKVHLVDTTVCGSTVGALHVLNRDPAFATARCSTDSGCTAYRLTSEQVNAFLLARPDACRNVVVALAKEVRKQTRAQRTPLLEQQGNPLPVLPVALAASIESFYRAGMNALINQSLMGGQRGAWFPNMHVQIPTRISYILGFKGLRAVLQSKVDTHDQPFKGLAVAIAPGVIMTPISSILEASNAGNRNPEPMTTRWMRGIWPRALREVIFGIGLNQLSDWYEERVPIANPVLANMAGSLSAGITSGYLSHVPHNISTLMLNNPKLTFAEHCRGYVKLSEARVAHIESPFLRNAAMVSLSILAPKGIIPRTTQIAGSFILLNGTINAIDRYAPSWLNWGITI